MGNLRVKQPLSSGIDVIIGGCIMSLTDYLTICLPGKAFTLYLTFTGRRIKQKIEKNVVGVIQVTYASTWLMLYDLDILL